MSAVSAPRVLVAWYPDWPVLTTGLPSGLPVAVAAANTVAAVSTAARHTRAWEPAVVAVAAFTPAVEVVAPGEVALSTQGPSRYFGGDEALAEAVAGAVDRSVGHPGCRVGVADGRFAAGLAARVAPAASGPVVVVPRGSSGQWLAPQPVTTLDPVLGSPDLADLLVRMGVRTLGDLAALPYTSVLGRFGPAGATAHRLARGLDPRPLAVRAPRPDLAVTAELDPPADRVDTAAFAAKALAGELHDRLAARGLVAATVVIEAETSHGEHLVRRWRHEGTLTAGEVAERVRWQLDGWLSGNAGCPSGGLTLLRLTPEEVCPDHGRQLGFWGGPVARDARAARALARAQGLLGPEEVVTAALAGGRDPAERAHLVAWGDRHPRTGNGEAEAGPWPGRLAGPAPAVVYRPALPAEVRDTAGRLVEVDGRGVASAAPAAVSVEGGRWVSVRAWAGPWPLEERWWDGGGRRRARFQVLLDGGEAYLLTREGGRWWVEALYA